MYFQDAYEFIAYTKQKYDLVIADRPDPIGAGKSLFKEKFYKNIYNVLSRKGVAIFQSGVTFLQKDEALEVIKYLKRNFKYTGIILTVVPSYIGGYMTLVWSSNRVNLLNKKVIGKTNIKTSFYNETIRRGSLYPSDFIKFF